MKIYINGYLLSVLFMFLMSASLGSYAAASESYQATVPVDGYSSNDYNKALPAALTQVLVNLSANPDVAKSGAVQNALEKSGKFVQSYQYASVVENGSKKISLIVRFSPKLIDGLLRESNQHIFSTPVRDSSQTLVWLVEKKSNNQFEVINGASNAVVSALDNFAKEQGVALLWPVMDLQDISAASPDQIEKLNEVVVRDASRRYEPSAILIGKIEQGADGKWQGNWKWLGANNQQTWQTTGVDASSAAVAVLSYLSPSSTTASAISVPAGAVAMNDNIQVQTQAQPKKPENLSWVQMKISGIHGLRDYGQVVKYLKNLKSVVNVDARELQGESAMLNVQISGGADIFENELSVGGQLVQDMYSNGAAPSTLLYYWNANTVQTAPRGEVYVPPQSVQDDMVDGE